jgi:spore germination protein YaaH
VKKIAILFAIVICFCIFGYYFSPKKQTLHSPLSNVLQNSVLQEPTKLVVQKKSEDLFVPYWGFSTKDIQANEFDRVLYFGISANEEGIDTTESGYKKLQQFIDLAPVNKEKLLTVRMVDSAINSKILDDPNIQEEIIQESIATAEKYGFSGIIFDFEINALAFPSVVSNITTFYKSFSTQTKKNKLSFAITIYGDTFYRARPYDLEKIAPLADKIYIMTYDFHKSRGNPGPNFPLTGRNTYGYDLSSMLEDFSNVVPSEKLVIVFGLFGYDWEVDQKNESVKNGIPLSFIEIKQQFIDTCPEKYCQKSKDTLSKETKVTYLSSEGKPHIIWFEDPISIEQKKAFLASKGFNATAIWAYSYY